MPSADRRSEASAIAASAVAMPMKANGDDGGAVRAGGTEWRLSANHDNIVNTCAVDPRRISPSGCAAACPAGWIPTAARSNRSV